MEKDATFKGFIVVTGPESTGKTELSKALAQKLNCGWIPELSRTYIEALNRPYNYSDVETIARIQIRKFHEKLKHPYELAVFDTGLIITKVWFDVVYQTCPAWLVEAIVELPKALHLLCATDLPWVPDSVRENGGEKREQLFEIYRNELNTFGFPYEIIEGFGEQRLVNASEVLHRFEFC